MPSQSWNIRPLRLRLPSSNRTDGVGLQTCSSSWQSSPNLKGMGGKTFYGPPSCPPVTIPFFYISDYWFSRYQEQLTYPSIETYSRMGKRNHKRQEMNASIPFITIWAHFALCTVHSPIISMPIRTATFYFKHTAQYITKEMQYLAYLSDSSSQWKGKKQWWTNTDISNPPDFQGIGRQYLFSVLSKSRSCCRIPMPSSELGKGRERFTIISWGSGSDCLLHTVGNSSSTWMGLEN